MATLSQSSHSVVRRKRVAEKLECSLSSLYNKLNPKCKYYDPTFPKPIRLGANSVGWIESEIDDWLQSRERVNGASEIVPSVTHAVLRPQGAQLAPALASECLAQSSDEAAVSPERSPSTTHTDHHSQECSAPTLILMRSSDPSRKARPIQVEVRRKRPVQVSCTR